MILGMSFLSRFDCCNGSAEAAGTTGTLGDAMKRAIAGDGMAEDESHLLRTVGWVSAALGAVALGLIVGRELRQRYKFNRQTPYDLYAHSGDELRDVDFGVGI
jgi:hypothetical protein